MILGIGIDMTEIERIEKACQRQAFFLHIYTHAEQELYGGKPASLAARFAVKEAVAKAEAMVVLEGDETCADC